ncbi:hypothetical protein [Lignipirellula cremea]|uniref:Uncharacterized protein n=1 Tax=Lignipirellula cremea TaxID=2528010 RepID=A0A518DTR9_9BACT|nr:hypothetical protein [Lignipirellula cremea]QDU95233.1 hypothetical protein Pla8534_30480 [Lignipirellula cremea]
MPLDSPPPEEDFEGEEVVTDESIPEGTAPPPLDGFRLTPQQVLMANWMLATHCVLAALVATCIRWEIRGAHWQVSICLGLTLANISLGGAWLAWGRANLVLRVGGLLALAALGGGAMGELTMVSRREFFSVQLVIACQVALLGLGLRVRGFDFYHDKQPARPASRWRFSVWNLMSLMTALAIGSATVNWFFVRVEWLTTIAMFVVGSATLGLVAIVGIGWRPQPGTVLLIPAVFVIGLCMNWGVYHGQIQFALMQTFVQAIALLAAMLLLRSTGLRFGRRAEEESEGVRS